MANTRELRSRRKSATNTRKITRTMELVASAKLKKAQDAAEASRPYAEGLAELVQRLAGDSGGDTHPLMVQREVRTVVLVLACSDRGLCGAYNVNLVKRLSDRAKELRAEGKQVAVISCGKKGAAILRFLGENVEDVHSGIMDAPRYPQAQEIAEGLMTAFLEGTYDRVEVIYSRFESVARQAPDVLTMLPAGGDEDPEAAQSADHADFIYHPDAESLLDALIPQTVKTALFSAFLQTSAGEHAARRTAMKNATDAAGDLIKQLTREYNRARQGKITQEIAEIVGAVEAMS